jgi:hypothetical protein
LSASSVAIRLRPRLFAKWKFSASRSMRPFRRKTRKKLPSWPCIERRDDLLCLLGVKIDVSKGIDQRGVFGAQILLHVGYRLCRLAITAEQVLGITEMLSL